MTGSRIYRRLGELTVALFLLIVFTPLPNLLATSLAIPPQLAPAEAIVVLGGGGVWPDGTLSNLSLRRALHGILLQQKGLAPLLVFSGFERDRHPTELEARADFARELGVPSQATLTVNTTTTRDEARRIQALLRPRGIRKILLVTDSQHMARAQLLFERAGFEVFAAPADDFSNISEHPEGRLELTRRVLEEILARLYYRLAGYL
ncbi:MAG TPA: YdcF family protein [Methylomirabilota bacterium]|nr:YdcF family protein [Methylomirabilota bacterium]